MARVTMLLSWPRLSTVLAGGLTMLLVGQGPCGEQDADGDGYTSQGGDCDDSDASVYPGAPEVCDGVDQNCDGEADEGVTNTYYFDADGDGYGNPNNPGEACELPSGYADNSEDCNDQDGNAYPGATEVCNEADDNCNGEIDENAVAIYYFDGDGDGYGDINNVSAECPPPEGYVSDAGDCNDLNPEVNPAAVETCNFIDDNCNGLTDEGFNLEGVAGGFNHSLGLCSDGSVWAWGRNNFGQLGNGAYLDSPLPVRVKNLSGAVAIDAGGYFSMALDGNGDVWGWGDNGYGQLGNGSTIDSALPIRIGGIGEATAIAAGFEHALVLLADQTVMAWGRNTDGQLGNGSNDDSASPVFVSSLSSAKGIAAGGYHSMALRMDGTVRTWGQNEFGQLGDGTRDSRNTPVSPVSMINLIDIEAGAYHSFALRNDYTVRAWGNNANGQLGDGTALLRVTPTKLETISNVGALAAGTTHTIALTRDGLVWAWGGNEYGQLGDGSTTSSLVPIMTGAPENTTSIAAGGYHNFSYYGAGAVAWGWGGNSYGQVGDGSTDDALNPVELTALP